MPSGIRLGSLVLGLVFVLAGACSSDSKKLDVGKACVLSSDCDTHLVCTLGKCHAACKAAADCPTGQECVHVSTAYVCQQPSEKSCATASCGGSMLCGTDLICRTACSKTVDCTGVQVCIGNVCANPTELDINGQLPMVTAPDGGVSDSGAKDVLAVDSGSKDLPTVDLSPALDTPMTKLDTSVPTDTIVTVPVDTATVKLDLAIAQDSALAQPDTARPADAAVHTNRGEVSILQPDAFVDASCITYVATTGDDWNEGASWTDAKATIQAGIDKAVQQGGCDVYVAAGTYKPTTSTVQTISILLRKDIRLFGGFALGAKTFAERDVSVNKTILSGDIGVVEKVDDNSRTVVTGADGATIDGFTIMGAYTSGGGGGVKNTATNFTIRNCTIEKNNASYYSEMGSGIYSSGDNLIIDATSISQNSTLALSSNSQGVVYLTGGSTLIINSHFEGNGVVALLVAGSYIKNTSLQVVNSGFSGNIQGAVSIDGIQYSGASATQPISAKLVNCSFVNNTATEGAAINSRTGNLELEGCSFTGNTAVKNGGAMMVMVGKMDRCMFDNNTATNYGGAVVISSNNSDSTIMNSVFFNNKSGDQGGGALYVGTGANLRLINTTIARNTSTVGGAVFVVDVTSRLTLLNSILWQNKPDEISGGNTTASTTINTGNYFTGTGNSGADPMFVDVAKGDLRLKAGSPALNAGSAEGAPTTDLLGVTRDGTPDLGCYEGAVSL